MSQSCRQQSRYLRYLGTGFFVPEYTRDQSGDDVYRSGRLHKEQDPDGHRYRSATAGGYLQILSRRALSYRRDRRLADRRAHHFPYSVSGEKDKEPLGVIRCTGACHGARMVLLQKRRLFYRLWFPDRLHRRD